MFNALIIKAKAQNNSFIYAALLCLVGSCLIVNVALFLSKDGLKSVYEERLLTIKNLDSLAVLLNQDKSMLVKAIAESRGDSPAQAPVSDIEKSIAATNTLWKSYLSGNLNPDEKVLASKFSDNYGQIVNNALKPAIGFIQAGDQPEALKLSANLDDLVAANNDIIDQINKIQVNLAGQEYSENSRRFLASFVSSISLLVLAISFAARYLTSRKNTYYANLDAAHTEIAELKEQILAFDDQTDQSIKYSLGLKEESEALIHAAKQELSDAASEFDGIVLAAQQNDYSVRISLHGASEEISDLVFKINTLLDGVEGSVNHILEESDSIKARAKDMALGKEKFYLQSQKQQACINDITNTIDEMAQASAYGDECARRAKLLTVATSEVAQAGDRSVEAIMGTLRGFQEAIGEINDMITVVDGIAAQSNILALNAVVEAAEAGEHGKGFAVVAAEVRDLALRSTAATKQMKAFIASTLSKVSYGEKGVRDVGLMLQEIAISTQNITGKLAELVVFSEGQKLGTDKIKSCILESDNQIGLGEQIDKGDHAPLVGALLDAAPTSLSALASGDAGTKPAVLSYGFDGVSLGGSGLNAGVGDGNFPRALDGVGVY